MARPLFIGDEISATGYRLAGIDVQIPRTEDVSQLLQKVAASASLIIITAEYMSKLSKNEQQRYLTQEDPVVVVVPDIRAQIPLENIAVKLRKQLGLLE